MSLDDIILDHESNQCLFVCAKCGAEYVTRDMLAMHMMDSARAGMCIETDTLTLPHIYSLQNATVNANTNTINNNNNSMHSNNFMSLNHKIFSAIEESLPPFRGFRNASSSSTSSSITDVQKDEDGIQSLLMNSKYQTNNNNLAKNVKMNFIHSLKVNKSDMFTTLATKDKIRMSSGKFNSNLSEYKGRLKNISSDMSCSQRCTSPAYPLIKSLGNQGSSSSTSVCAIAKSFNSPPDTVKSTNINSKCTNTLQNKSQTAVDRATNNQEGFKITCADAQMKVCDTAKSLKPYTKCKDAKNVKAIKRSRSLPSPRTLWNQQMCSEPIPAHVNENNILEKTGDLSTCDEILHKTRRDRKCYKRSGYKNLRKLVNYNRSKFKVAQNSHIISPQITNCYNPDKTDGHSANCHDEEAVPLDVQHDNNKQVTSLDEGNNQKIKMIGNAQLTFPYICDYCQIGFVQQALYCLHMGMHCVNNPLKCNMCARNCLDVYDFFSHTLHFC
ncbi:unnamed protein product [Trichobilharzia szidati]|nr:unnamed protein product [Trichobilharzia szidati]